MQRRGVARRAGFVQAVDPHRRDVQLVAGPNVVKQALRGVQPAPPANALARRLKVRVAGLVAAHLLGRHNQLKRCAEVLERASQQVVGTYRLLRQSVAARNLGFYSENEFDLENLKRLPGEALELGRSCVAAEHRSFAVINLLWSAITHYATAHGVSRMFGCASLHAADAAGVQALYRHLSHQYLAPEKYRVTPLPECRVPQVEDNTCDEREVRRRIPPLLKGYLRAGAVVCGEPAFDAEFGTADVLVLLEMEKLTARYQQHYAEQAA